MRFILDTRSITTITNFRTIISLKGAFCEPRVAVLTLVTRTHLSSIYARLPKTFINSGHSFSKKQECQPFHRTPITSIKDAYATTNTACSTFKDSAYEYFFSYCTQYCIAIVQTTHSSYCNQSSYPVLDYTPFL